MTDEVTVRAIATGVVRRVSKEDAEALLDWRDDNGAEVWERVDEADSE